VDPADQDLAERWFGNAGEAARAAAVRELAEEVGLAVTGEAVVAAGPERSLAPIDASPPRPDTLQEIARWIAPRDVPVRFDARYYAVRMQDSADPDPDGAEAARAWWISPTDLLAAWESEEVRLYWPTHYTVVALAGRRDAAGLLRLRLATREPDDDDLDRLPRSVFFQDR
jgi:8-oxo-dGTP pyrophosphatase MutT (NUDIX family)